MPRPRSNRIATAIAAAVHVPALLFIALLMTGSVRADEPNHTLAQLKTAYLFNIAKFVRWPEGGTTVRLCIDSNSSLLPVASQLSGRDLGDGRRVQVVAATQVKPECHLFFASRAAAITNAVERGFARDLTQRATLTIGDSSQALEQGFQIQLFVQRDKLRFAVNQEHVRRAPFQISANLMRLARRPG